MKNKVKGFKGFDKDLKCIGKQYEVGQTFEEPEANLCEKGLHFCENPLDVFDYYFPFDSRYCEIEGDEVLDDTHIDSKRVCKKLTIKAEIGLKGIIDAGIKFIFERNKIEDIPMPTVASGYYSQLAASGYSSKLAASGDYSQLAASGYSSKLAASGDRSKLAASGDYSQLAASGDYSQLAASGDYSQLAASGDYSQLAASGYSSKLAASGDYSQLAASGDYSQCEVGKESIAASIGISGKAKGTKGSWLVLAEYYQDNQYNFHVKQVKSRKVDGRHIKPDTWYTMKEGKFVKI